MKLVNGLWMCEREDTMIDCIEASWCLWADQYPKDFHATMHYGKISSLGTPTK